jgi:protocatechuate 3,4-dioxygenase, beta subunit
MLTLIAAVLFSSLTSTVRIAPPSEPGERLVISGTVYRADGRTPAPNVVILAYHTDAKGIYPQRNNSDERGSLQGRLRTDAKGRYRIDTIRPGGYPGRVDPAHIHLVVQPEGKPEVHVPEIVFDDDPRTNAVRGRRCYAVVKVSRRDGVWTGSHDIVLPRE